MLLNINMHREDNSKYLLYIEPKAVDKLQEPINDELTEMMEKALTKSKKGAASYSQLEDKGDGYNGQTRRVPSFREGIAPNTRCLPLFFLISSISIFNPKSKSSKQQSSMSSLLSNNLYVANRDSYVFKCFMSCLIPFVL